MKKIVLILSLAFFSPTSWAYEPEITHKDLSLAALNKSSLNIDPALLSNLGLKPISAKQIFLHNGEFSNLDQLFIFGALHEDDGKRAFNHFYDPFYDRPLTVLGIQPGSVFGVPNLKTLDWALEENNILEQSYSYHDARDAFYKALTYNENTPGGNYYVRNNYWGNMFSNLGQVIHLIQDMAQPQHVRNDAHLDEAEWYGFNPLYNPSLFERYTAKEKRVAQKIRDLANASDTTAVFPGSSDFKTPRDFWKNSAGSGLAQFTNRNFVSQGTNFLVGFFGNNVTTAKYPLPAPGTPTPYAVDELYLSQNVPTPDGIKALCSDVSINCTMTMYPSALSLKASTLSIFDQDMQARGVSVTYDDGVNTSTYSVGRLFALNRFNFDDAHSILIPKAVGYSAGLINYFFRGTMEITPPAEQVYGIVDHSTIHQTNPLSGFEGFRTIKLKVRNTTPGGEAMTGGKLVAVAKFHRNGCYKDDLSGEFTQDAAGNLITPCPDYRTNTEEIVVSTSVKDAAGNVLDTVSLDTNAARQLTFTFANAIPINATDLYLQVVYRGNLGDETDAVVVATKDLFEPTYLALLNSTDQFLFNGKFVTSTDPALIAVFDGNKDGLLDVPYRPTTLGINFGFRDTFAGTALGYINYLPPARFSRLAILTDRSPFSTPLQAFGLQTGSVFESTGIYGLSAQTNQVEPESGLFRVSAVEKVRGISGYYVLPFYFGYGTPDTGDVKTMPELVDKTPFPVTSLTFP